MMLDAGLAASISGSLCRSCFFWVTAMPWLYEPLGHSHQRSRYQPPRLDLQAQLSRSDQRLCHQAHLPPLGHRRPQLSKACNRDYLANNKVEKQLMNENRNADSQKGAGSRGCPMPGKTPFRVRNIRNLYHGTGHAHLKEVNTRCCNKWVLCTRWLVN